jgi:hypothetical protein
MRIRNAKDFRVAIQNGPHAWPGGYPVYFVMGDGEAVSYKAAIAERKNLLSSLVEKRKTGAAYSKEWLPFSLEINWEDSSLYCAHTGERIESAYAEEEAA